MNPKKNEIKELDRNLSVSFVPMDRVGEKGAIAIKLTNGIGFGSTEFHVIRPIPEKSNSYWIYNLTTLIKFRRVAERKMTGSAGQKRVSTNFLNNIEVVVPPIELQNQFANFANKIDKLKFN